METITFLKNKELITEDFNIFVIQGHFGKYPLNDLLEEFARKKVLEFAKELDLSESGGRVFSFRSWAEDFNNK